MVRRLIWAMVCCLLFASTCLATDPVAFVRRGTFKQCPYRTVGDAVSSGFRNEHWSAGTADDGQSIVNVEGIVDYDNQRYRAVMYAKARDFARERGIIIADTKFEFGTTDDGLILIDEVLTPDSSRFWPAEDYAPGHSQPSYDKQYLRDWLTAIGFNKQPPAPHLPEDVVAKTREKYLTAYKVLTGKTL